MTWLSCRSRLNNAMIKQKHRDRCRILLLRDFGIPWVASGEGGKGLSSYFLLPCLLKVPFLSICPLYRWRILVSHGYLVDADVRVAYHTQHDKRTYLYAQDYFD